MICRCLIVMCLMGFIGGTVFAAPAISILPDKGFYHVGDPVNITVRASMGTQVQARIFDLTTEVKTLSAALVDGEAILQWTPPPVAPRGYGVSVEIYDDAGTRIAAQTSAFDVLTRWIDAPRYSFFSDFSAARLTDTPTTEWLLQHHINGVQFYDWQYRWENLLPETERFDDGLGRPQSMTTIRRLIDMLHAHNIAAMPYTAIYGASAAFYRQHPDWGLFNAQDKVYDFGENSFIDIMNPAPGSPWTLHLMGEYADVLDNSAFDGIHIDQYGSPKTGYDHHGQFVDLAEAMPAFINQTAAVVQAHRPGGVTLFNCVGNWPIQAVASAQQDAAYIEVWPPYNDYLDLNRIITNAETLGSGKPVILTAYIPPQRTINWRLANSVILASGGTHLETGEPETMLADPYFPKFGTLISEQQPIFRRYYDFQVRYENVLTVATTAAADRQKAVDMGDIRTQGLRARDRVVPIVRDGGTFETISLVNFIGVTGTHWNAPSTTEPTPFSDIQINLAVDRPIAAVWTASPDAEDSMNAVSLPYTVTEGTLHVTLPTLHYWSMIVVEYTDGR